METCLDMIPIQQELKTAVDQIFERYITQFVRKVAQYLTKHM